MTADEQRKRAEEAEKQSIIGSQIEMPIEQLGRQLSDERKAGLKRMTKPELEELAQNVISARTSQDAIKMVVEAICATDAARRMAEDAKSNALSGPAKMDMDL